LLQNNKIKLMEPKHLFDEEFMDLPNLMIFHKEDRITRVPEYLKVSQAQHMILGKIYKYEKWHNQGPYIAELDTHTKSIKALEAKRLVKMHERRVTLDTNGYAALCFQILHAKYKRDKVTAVFEAKRIAAGQLKPEEATSTLRLKNVELRSPIEQDAANKEQLLISCLKLLFTHTTPSELAHRTRDTRSTAVRLAVTIVKPHIEKLVRRIKITQISTVYDEKNRVRISISWLLMPYRRQQVTFYDVTSGM